MLTASVLGIGGVSRLTSRTKVALSLIQALSSHGLWPPMVPSVVLAESLQGNSSRDANTNRFLKTCVIETIVSVDVARRAAELRRRARTGSAVDALVVALAEPGGTILTGDKADIEALAAFADRVIVQVI